MIAQAKQLSHLRLGLHELLVTELHERDERKVAEYVALLKKHPEADFDPILVEEYVVAPGKSLFAIRNGHHRFVASLIAGRRTMSAIVIRTDQV